jgi:hypothetical protein
MRIRLWMFGQGGGGGRVYFSCILMSKATAKRNIFFQNIVGSLFETLSISLRNASFQWATQHPSNISSFWVRTTYAR